jgi:hypothetical protein
MRRVLVLEFELPTKGVNSPAGLTRNAITKTNISKTRGFILWEVMLALTIFCAVVVALTSALQQTVDTSIILRDESQVRLEIRNLLDETSVMKLVPGKSEVQVGDGRVHYEREIRTVQAKTARGELLPSLFEIKVQASWRSSGKDRSENAALIVYQP